MPQTDPLADLRVDAQAAPLEGQSVEQELVTWIMGRVNRWREYRDNAFKERWGEYYRLWRGRWSAKDKNRNSERSKLIAPALSQAIDMTVSEMEEATFGREQWFDVRQDLNQIKDPQAKAQLVATRDFLLEDMERDNVTDAIAMTYLNGALFGNGIAKIVVDTRMERFPGALDPITQKRRIESRKKTVVKLDPLPADEFVPDPAATNIEDMLGCAHELNKPTAWVNRLQAKGFFRRSVVNLASEGNDSMAVAEREDLEGFLKTSDTTFITEYHGLVPMRLLPLPEGANETELDRMLREQPVDGDDGPMVEAIVTIGNKTELLRAIENPFWMKDRSIISYQHDKVPGRFWGRSVAEKGFNPQKALDAELRARMDALALISNPMMGADITRLPRNFDLKIRPGKLWLTNGAPKDIIMPVQFQGLDPNTFNQTGEMERMVQMGTGAMDTATPIKMNERNSTATGTSVQMQSFVKRSKRAMNNVNRNFLSPLIRKILWRYMQFASDRYTVDTEFRVSGTLGIVARELEQNQLTQMLGLLPEGSPPQMALVKAIFDNANSPFKNELNAAVDQMMAPPSEEEQARQDFIQQMELVSIQAGVEEQQLKNNKLQTDALLNLAKISEIQADTEIEGIKVSVEVRRLAKEFEELRELGRQNDAAMMNAAAALRKAANETERDRRGGTEQGGTG